MKIDDFVNIKHLGKGKFGVVSLVRHKKTNFICALKTVSKKVVKE
jgi:serine/threonine protein kinase